MWLACACYDCREYGPVEIGIDVPDEINCANCGTLIGDEEEFEAERDDDNRPYFYHTRKDCDA